MKKYLLKYCKAGTNEWKYVNSVDENGCTYSLVNSKEKADRFYGKNALRTIERRVSLDKKKWHFYSTYEIEEIEEEPQWYFELEYAISHYDKVNKPIKRGFFEQLSGEEKSKIIDKQIKYKGWSNADAITVHGLWDFGVEILERYYNWRKLNFKGTPRTY